MNRLKRKTGTAPTANLATAMLMAILYLAAAPVANAQRASIKVSLDSAYILMGKQTSLNVQVTDRSSDFGEIKIPKDSFPNEVELSRNQPPEKRSEASGVKQITAQYIIQSFDSGAYRIPPLMYISGGDTVFSNSVTLKVLPVDVSELADINPEKGTLDVKSRWYDGIPDWLTENLIMILIGIIIIGGALCIYLILSKKITVNILTVKKPEPPYQVAIKKLAILKEEQLWEKGQEKAFYTQLTDILREYLDRRFGINAMEMTSTQINAALHDNEETRSSKTLMEQILEVADFVKFAKAKPLREDNIKSFDAAIRFVEDTKPAEQLPENDTNGTDAGKEVSSSDEANTTDKKDK